MKSIICTHGMEVWEPLSRMRRQLRCSMPRWFWRPSRATADYLVSVQGVASEKVRVLPWGLDPDFETRVSGDSPRHACPQNFRRGG